MYNYLDAGKKISAIGIVAIPVIGLYDITYGERIDAAPALAGLMGVVLEDAEGRNLLG